MKLTTALATASLAGAGSAQNTCPCGPGGGPRPPVTVTETVTVYPSSSVVSPASSSGVYPGGYGSSAGISSSIVAPVSSSGAPYPSGGYTTTCKTYTTTYDVTKTRGWGGHEHTTTIQVSRTWLEPSTVPVLEAG
jgi:hypothetical protein